MSVQAPDTRQPADHRLETVDTVVELLRAELRAKLTLHDLADAVGYSPFHLARLFRAVVGIPPGEFRTALRFDQAKRLLLTEGVSVTDACFAVGFDSLGTFSTRFHKLVGVAPDEFRRLPDTLDRPATAGSGRTGPSISSAVVRGTVHGAAGTVVYIGLFPHAIARSRPVAGRYLLQPGRYELTGVPPGSYRVLAAGIGPDADPLTRLVPGAGLRVGAASEPVLVRRGDECVHRDVWLRRQYAHEPPVLVALAALTPQD